MHFVRMSQFYAPRCLSPTDSSWQQSFLLCLHLPASYLPTWQGFLLFWEISSSRLPFRVYGKLAQLSQRKLLSVLCCHLLPSMLPLRKECCALGASLATIFFQKYSAFSKNIQSYSSALQLFGFDSDCSLSIQKAETTTQLLVQLWKKKLIVCSFPSLSSCQPQQAGMGIDQKSESSGAILLPNPLSIHLRFRSYSIQLLLNHAAGASCNKVSALAVGIGILS